MITGCRSPCRRYHPSDLHHGYSELECSEFLTVALVPGIRTSRCPSTSAYGNRSPAVLGRLLQRVQSPGRHRSKHHHRAAGSQSAGKPASRDSITRSASPGSLTFSKDGGAVSLPPSLYLLMTSFRFALLPFVFSFTAYSAEIVLPATALERAAPVTAVFRTNPQATGERHWLFDGQIPPVASWKIA